MVKFTEKQVEKIKNAKDAKSVEHIITDFVIEMKKNGTENYRVANFIRGLDISLLMLERKELSDKELENVVLAQKILINKIVQGTIHDFVKSN